ncbi:transcriptional regulator CynR [Mycobacterium sp. CBMA 234]|uniref:transcriptional regulator CynR n=1 Tax=Mycolicibacterium sp. CBMA 234 TaxID=1918495 RepID=UPI0012DDFF0F|nr:transcriptional regulator CynR [Mycolicibacterium sp. CBMA 234]MUL66626.1 transcriptional regulator CynR [Mycolicibacterium sp. CBMA 234]
MAGLELRHLRYLLAVAENGNFSRAAEELYVSQPTLSQQIKQLENTLGVQLLDRSGRTVRLTDAGAAYAERARSALRELAAAERAIEDVQDLSRGHIRLGITPTFITYLIGPLTAELYARHPGISLTVSEMSQDGIEAGLLDDDLDIGIAFVGAAVPGIDAAALFTEHLGLVTSGPRAQTLPDPLPARDLDDVHLALLSSDFLTRTHINTYFAEHHVDPRITVEANSVQALTEMVQRTPLATVLPDAVTHDHPYLTPVPLDPPIPTRTVALLRKTAGYHSAAAVAFARITHDLVTARGYAPPG